MYEYKCPVCGVVKQTGSYAPISCRDCGVDMKRLYGFNTTNMPTNAGSKMKRN